jgi:hypothetical protein
MKVKLVDLNSAEGWFVLPGRQVGHFLKQHYFYHTCYVGVCYQTSSYILSDVKPATKQHLKCEQCVRKLVLSSDEHCQEIYKHLSKSQRKSSNKKYWMWHIWQKLYPDWRTW